MSVFPILYSADVERSAQFYEDALDFERTYRWPPDGGELEYAYLRRGDHGLGIARGEGRGGFELCVYVDDVDATAARLRGLDSPEVQAPEDMPWGERMAAFADPDGHRVHITMSL